MNVSKLWMCLMNWLALISASGTTMFRTFEGEQQDYYRYSMLYLYCRKFKFQKVKLLKLGVNSTSIIYHITHAERDTSSRLIV